MKKLLFTAVLAGSMMSTNASALETHSEQEIQEKLIGCHTSYKLLKEEFGNRFDESEEAVLYLSKMMLYFTYVYYQYPPLDEEGLSKAVYDAQITVEDILLEKVPDPTQLLTFCRDEVLSHDKTNKVK